MKCLHCGNPLKPNSRFCDRCGCPINHNDGFYSSNCLGNILKPKVRKWPWITGSIMVLLSVAAVIVFIIMSSTPERQGSFDTTASFSTDMRPGFVFDETNVIALAGEPLPVPMVEAVVPASGSVGDKVQICGSHLLDAGLKAVMLGESELNMYTVSDDMVEVFVPFGAQSGKVMLVYAGQTIDAGYFEVIAQQKKLLLEQDISPSIELQTVSADTISITIPGNALEHAQTVRIEQIDNPHPVNLPESVLGTSFSITIGEMRQFNDIVTIEYTLPGSVDGEPSAAYFDEDTSLWDTLPSEVVDGKLSIYTDHLTDFYVYCWGKAIYSPDGNFKIYYQENDKHNYGSSMDDLAQKVGQTLEEARKDYDAKIPAAYREDFLYMGFKDPLDVYLDDAYGDGQYAPLTNNLHLMTNYQSQDDFETMVAHELFHAYQDAVWSELGWIGKMGKSENKWAVEALAELAAYELAFPEKNRQRLLTDGAYSQDPYNTVDMVHEYSMSCFLRYLLRKTNSTFEEMWIYVAGCGKINLNVSLNDFFKSKSNDFISLEMSYMDFWRDVIGNADAPMHAHPEMQFSRRKIYFKPNQHTAELRYQTNNASTTAFNLFAAKAFPENMPVRIFNVACIKSGDNSAMCTQLSGIQNPKDLNNLRVSGGHLWDHVYADASLGDTRQLYTLEQGKNDIVLIGLESVQSNTLYGVKISEIEAQCKPQKLEQAVPGKQQKFEVAFKDIFDYVREVEVVIDFGDGTVKRYAKANETSVFSGYITHTFGENITGDAVTFSMYDVSGGGRELISRLVIPMTEGDAVTLTASPNPAAPGDTVSLSANITDTGYTYQWEFGDGTGDEAKGVAYTSHVYENPGTYSASVTVLDAEGKRYGTAKQTVTVQAPEQTDIEETVPSPEAEQTADYSDIYGTWQCISETYMNAPTNQIWYWVETLQLNPDGTFHYEFVPIVTDVREGKQPDYDSISTNIYEYESGSGTLRIFNEGESASDAFGYLFFDDGLNDDNVYYVNDTLIYSSSVFRKVE